MHTLCIHILYKRLHEILELLKKKKLQHHRTINLKAQKVQSGDLGKLLKDCWPVLYVHCVCLNLWLFLLQKEDTFNQCNLQMNHYNNRISYMKSAASQSSRTAQKSMRCLYLVERCLWNKRKSDFSGKDGGLK